MAGVCNRHVLSRGRGVRGSEPPELGRTRTASSWLNKSSCWVDVRGRSLEDRGDHEQGGHPLRFRPPARPQNTNQKRVRSDKPVPVKYCDVFLKNFALLSSGWKWDRGGLLWRLPAVVVIVMWEMPSWTGRWRGRGSGPATTKSPLEKES